MVDVDAVRLHPKPGQRVALGGEVLASVEHLASTRLGRRVSVMRILRSVLVDNFRIVLLSQLCANSRLVNTMSTISGTVSTRAQSRCSSQARDTQLIGCAPAWVIRSSPAWCASGEVPPTASTTGYTSNPSRSASSVGNARHTAVHRAA